MDFRGLKGINNSIPINPRDLFSSLTKRSIRSLRPGQTEVLKKWYDRRSDADIAIQMNTGSGKTLVGLLICYSSLLELKKPSIYLCPTKQLVSQVMREGKKNAIPVTDEPNDTGFKMANSILVTTVHRLFNGKSVIERASSGGVRIGRIVIDDAQTAIEQIQDQFRIEAPYSSNAYKELLSLFRDDLVLQDSLSAERLTQGNGYCTYCAVSPRAIWEKQNEVLKLLHREEDNDYIKFSLPLIGNTISICTITFSSNFVEISAPCPNIKHFSSYSKAEGHVFLSATFSNIDELVTEMAVDESILPIISPESASDCGDRMILSLDHIEAKMTENSVGELLVNLSNLKLDDTERLTNIVIITTSKSRAEEWAKRTNGRLVMNEEVEGAVECMRNGSYIGILIIVNRYDGIDFPDDSCRVLLIDGMAEQYTGERQRRARALYNTPIHHESIAHRFEQGIGRGIRSENDFCAVLVLGDELQMATHAPNRTALFSPVLQRQLELSHQVEELIVQSDESIKDNVLKLVELFLRRDDQWERLSSQALSSVTYTSDWTIDELSVARRSAFDEAVEGDYRDAVKLLRKGIDSLDDPEAKGWYLEEVARYAQQFDGNESQKVLETAHKLNGQVIKPIWNERRSIYGTVKWQADAIVESFLAIEDASMVHGAFFGRLSSITWGTLGEANRNEEIIKEIGKVLGFNSCRPEKELKDGGPDNLWQVTNNLVYSIELKTDVSRTDQTITKAEMSQTHNSLTWTKKHYPDAMVIPVMVHPSETYMQDVNPPEGLRIITQEKLSVLSNALNRFANLVSLDMRWKSADEVQRALVDNHLTAKEIVNYYSVVARRHK